MKAYIIFSLLVIAGLVLLLVNANLSATHWSSIWTSQLASVVLIAGTFGILDKAVLNRDTHERLSKLFKIHESITQTGLVNVDTDSNSYDYGPMIRTSATLDIVLNDGRTWISSKVIHFQHRFGQNVKTDILLMDPNSPAIEQLAAKTGYSVEEQRDKTRQAIQRIREEFEKHGQNGELRIWFVKYYPTHSIYLGADEVVLTLYGISSGRRPVPAFVFRRDPYGDFVYKHISDDVANIKREAQCIYDSAKQPHEQPGFDFAAGNHARVSHNSTAGNEENAVKSGTT